jgi:hypothetical protein
MGINFPNTPTTGQLYPQPPVAGQPVYRWDGQKWTTQGATATKTPVYTDGSTAMTAQLKLFGSPPVATNDAVPKSYSDLGIRSDFAQSLTTAQQVQARQNVYAAPFDALAYNGIQINGSMELSQLNGATPVTASGTYVVDGWLIGFNGSMAVSAAQVADAPSGYNNSLKVTVTTADPTLAASDYTSIQQPIEGFRTSRLAFGTAAAQPVSIGFLTKIHRTGTYSGGVRNSANTRSYPFSFTQNVADTWEYKTITVPGDVTGTWVGNTNGIGLSIFFTMAAGTTFQAPANAWATGNFIASTGTINGVAATTDVFQITGVVILPGIELPSAARAPFIARSYTQELHLCLRYWENNGYFLNLSAPAAGIIIGVSVPFMITKRATPAMSVLGSPAYANCSGLTLSNAATTLFMPYVTSSAAGAVAFNCTWVADARF